MSLSISVERPSSERVAPGKVAEVVDGQGDVGGQGLADGLAVLPSLGHRQHLEVGLDGVGDAVEDGGPLGERRLAPGVLRRVGGVEGQLHVFGGRSCDFAEGLAVDRADVRHVLALDRRHPLAADEVVVTRLDLDQAAGLPRGDEGPARGCGCRGYWFCSEGHSCLLGTDRTSRRLRARIAVWSTRNQMAQSLETNVRPAPPWSVGPKVLPLGEEGPTHLWRRTKMSTPTESAYVTTDNGSVSGRSVLEHCRATPCADRPSDVTFVPGTWVRIGGS